MSVALVVRSAFDSYAPGHIITDQEEIKKIMRSAAAGCVVPFYPREAEPAKGE